MPPKDFYFSFGKNLKIIFYFWVKERGGRRKYPNVGGNLKKRLTTKNIQENEAISNCKIE